MKPFGNFPDCLTVPPALPGPIRRHIIRMPGPARPQKITFRDMSDMGVRGVLIYCSDYRCSHSVATSADQWPDDFRLSDID